MIRIPLRSTWSRIVAGLMGLALFALIIWWGASSHALGTTLLSLFVVGVLLVGGRLIRGRFRGG